MSAEASPPRSESASALAPGTRLHEFELQKILGIGGFGIVYQAFDHALEREVAIKEYMPASLVGRTETMRVSLRSASDEESFALGLKSFVNEAKLLARFDHPSLLKVYRYWEDNGTAYMAMPVLRGRTLKQIRLAMEGPADEAWLRQLLTPLLGAIEKLHLEGVYHRDIAPDNIQIEPDGRPVLMDFGAARRVLSDKTQSLTAILKPAYAPIEQYGEAGAVKQGPWTDLYALGATLHYMLLGRPPAPATARTVDDEATLLTRAQLPGCSEGFLQAVVWMLQPRPLDRPQSVSRLREVLEGRAAVPLVAGMADMRTQVWERTDVLPPGAGGRLDVDVAAPSPPAAGVTEHVWLEPDQAPAAAPTMPADATVRVAPPASAAAAAPRKSAWPWALAALVAAGAAAALFWPRSPSPDPALVAPGPAPVASAAVPLVEPAAAPATVVAPLSPVAPVAPAASVPSTLSPASAAAAAADPAVPTAGAPPPAAAATRPAPSRPAETRPAENRAPRAIEVPPRATTPPPAAVGPGPACGARDGVRYLVCMERECASPAFEKHPACERLRQ